MWSLDPRFLSSRLMLYIRILNEKHDVLPTVRDLSKCKTVNAVLLNIRAFRDAGRCQGHAVHIDPDYEGDMPL
jgi:hypothetical protein